jgi:hypothetical protein
MKHTLNLSTIGGLWLLATTTLSADSSAIIAKLQAPVPGIEPVVLYLDSAETNSGQGGSGLIATSGERLSGQGRDPWGNETGAFGPAVGAKLGTAIQDSDKIELLAGQSGSVLLCVKIPDGTNGLILSRGAWGETGVFDLRNDTATNEIRLWVSSEGSEPVEFKLGNYTKGEWSFIAMTWQPDSNGPLLETLLVTLQSGASPQIKTFSLPAVGNPGKPVEIAGRTRSDLQPVVLAGGLYWGLAIYEQPVPIAALQELAEAMQTEAKP